MTADALPRELVLASAGAGKTYHLSSRIIGLLDDGAEPEEVLASTFTRKAAGEILDRVLYRVAEAGLEPEKARELAREALLGRPDGSDPGGYGPREALGLLGEVAPRLHRFEVGTLDSVFVRVARGFWPELDLPPGWRIVQGPAAERLLSEALQEVLEDGPPEERAELVRMLARGRATRRVHGRLMDQIEELHRLHRGLAPEAEEPWSPFRDRTPPDDPEAARERLAARVGEAELPTTNAGDPDSRWVDAREELVGQLEAGDWEELLDGGLGALALEEEPTYYGKSPTPGIAGCLGEIRELAAAELGAAYDAQARAMGRLAARFDGAFGRLQREEGAYRFEDLTHRLGRDGAATGRADLGYRLDRSVRHLLLDEFQDTAPAQWEALRPAAERVAGRPAAESGVSVVADPKQSIYGWRGADPALAGRVGRELGLEERRLDRSWRSAPAVLEFVNELFGDLPSNPLLEEVERGRDVARRWSEAFAEHRPAPPLEGEAGRVRLEVGPEADVRSKAPEAMMAFAADRAAELRRRAPAATVGVLTRTNEAVARVIGELRGRGVEASEEGGVSVGGSAPAAAVLSLLTLADHPGDRVARYHVAETPLGGAVGYTDHEDDVGARRLAERVRGRLLTDGYGETLAAWRRALAPAVGDRGGRRLRQLVELGYRWDGEATLRPGDFVRFVEAERVEDPRAAAVRVMTVHQAKGLEFDAVVLPELDAGLTGGGGTRAAALPERDPETGRVRRVFPRVKKALRPLFPEMAEAGRQDREATLRDAFGVLYVACTRARRALHLLVSESSVTPSTSAKTFARLALSALGRAEEEGEEGDVLLDRGDPAWPRELAAEAGREPPEEAPSAEEREEGAGPAARPDPGQLRVDPGRSAGRMLRHRTPSDLAGGGPDLPELLRPGGGAARARGEVVHGWLRAVEWIEDGLPEEAELRRVAARAAPAMGEEEVGELLARFRRWLRAGPVRRSLSRAAALARARERLGTGEAAEAKVSVETEWPFMHRSGGELVTGQVDRLVLYGPVADAPGEHGSGDGDGAPPADGGGAPGFAAAGAEVIDFKTDDVEGAELEAAAERYRPQVEGYRRAAAELLGLEPAAVRGALVFLPAGRSVPLR